MAINEETAQPSISAADSQPTLQDLERIIERGKTTFLEVANALHAIKSRDLFKETHPTWEAYVKERWGFSRQHAHRLIQAKKVAEMSPAGDKPKTEREARGRLKSAPRKESSKSNAASSLREIAERFERDLSHWETFLPDVYLTRLLKMIQMIIDGKLMALETKWLQEHRHLGTSTHSATRAAIVASTSKITPTARGRIGIPIDPKSN